MITKALTSLRPGAQWVLRGDTYEGLDWLDTEQTKPNEQELTDEAERLQAEWVATEYQRQRAPAYPPIGEQLDALFHAGVFPAEMAERIQAVKDQFPKV